MHVRNYDHIKSNGWSCTERASSFDLTDVFTVPAQHLTRRRGCTTGPDELQQLERNDVIGGAGLDGIAHPTPLWAACTPEGIMGGLVTRVVDVISASSSSRRRSSPALRMKLATVAATVCIRASTWTGGSRSRLMSRELGAVGDIRANWRLVHYLPTHASESPPLSLVKFDLAKCDK